WMREQTPPIAAANSLGMKDEGSETGAGEDRCVEKHKQDDEDQQFRPVKPHPNPLPCGRGEIAPKTCGSAGIPAGKIVGVETRRQGCRRSQGFMGRGNPRQVSREPWFTDGGRFDCALPTHSAFRLRRRNHSAASSPNGPTGPLPVVWRFQLWRRSGCVCDRGCATGATAGWLIPCDAEAIWTGWILATGAAACGPIS